MPYWRCYCHIVWATDHREPLISSEMETPIYRIIAHKGNDQGGKVYAVGGMADHIHVIAASPPSIAPAMFIKGLKGASSRFAHTEFQRPFAWQVGYGIFSISQQNLSKAIEYVLNQKQHHGAGTVISAMERFTSEDDGPKIMPQIDWL